MISFEESKPTLHGSERGFTLLEILIVIMLIAGVTTLLLPDRSIKSRKQLERALDRISKLSKEIRQASMRNRKTYRLVFDLKEKETLLVVERGKKSGKLGAAFAESKLREKLGSKEENPDFEIAREITKEPTPLDGGFRVKQVEIAGANFIIEEGRAEIYYVPQGFTEAFAIQLEIPETDYQWTLMSNPLTGKVERYSGWYELKDLLPE